VKSGGFRNAYTLALGTAGFPSFSIDYQSHYGSRAQPTDDCRDNRTVHLGGASNGRKGT